MAKRFAIALLSLAISLAASSLAAAQMRAPGFGGGRGGFAPPAHHQPRGPAYFGDPFLYSDYYPGYSFVADAAPPQVIVVQAAPAAPPPEPEAKIEPLMIEWQGDHYARYGGSAHDRAIPTDYAEPAAASRATYAVVTKPAIVIYRDGHREDVPRYAIVSGVLYARGDYWQDGYWTKNIQLSSLNIPATMKANQENGVRFVLPSGPNEVVTRP